MPCLPDHCFRVLRKCFSTPFEFLQGGGPPRRLTDRLGRDERSTHETSAIGTAQEVKGYIDAFTQHADADELIVVHHGTTIEARLRSVVDLLADVAGLTP